MYVRENDKKDKKQYILKQSGLVKWIIATYKELEDGHLKC